MGSVVGQKGQCSSRCSSRRGIALLGRPAALELDSPQAEPSGPAYCRFPRTPGALRGVNAKGAAAVAPRQPPCGALWPGAEKPAACSTKSLDDDPDGDAGVSREWEPQTTPSLTRPP
jgi:hypothetical protein